MPQEHLVQGGSKPHGYRVRAKGYPGAPRERGGGVHAPLLPALGVEAVQRGPGEQLGEIAEAKQWCRQSRGETGDSVGRNQGIVILRQGAGLRLISGDVRGNEWSRLLLQPILGT